MLGRFALLVGSILVTLFFLELGCRLVRDPALLLTWENLVLKARLGAADLNPEKRFSYDSALGYVQRAGLSSSSVRYNADGFRVGSPLANGAVADPPILTTGDSYTQGDEVDDEETWPSYLQGLMSWRTVNAGVAAYGLDQTVLRTEQLVPKLKPALVVVGFIADNVRRAEMKRT